MHLALHRPPRATAVHTIFLRAFHTTSWSQARSRPSRSVAPSSMQWPSDHPHLVPASTTKAKQDVYLWQYPQSFSLPPRQTELEDTASYPSNSCLKVLCEGSATEVPNEELPDSTAADAGSDVVRLPTDVSKALSKVAEFLALGHVASARLRVQQKLTAAILHLHRIPSSQLSQDTDKELISGRCMVEGTLGSGEDKEGGELAYRILAQGALELFLDARDLEGAELVLCVLHTHGAAFPFPLAIKARLLAARYASRDRDGNGKVNADILINNLESIFRQRKFLRSSTAEADFRAILKQLVFVPSPQSSRNALEEKAQMLKTMERVVQTYVRCQRECKDEGTDDHERDRWTLDAWTLAFMISRNFESGRAKRAGNWLGQARQLLSHSSGISSTSAAAGSNDSETAKSLSLPYKAYLFHALRLRHLPDQVAALKLPHLSCLELDGHDPRNIYRPFLKTMKTDGALPDVDFVNIILRAESEMGAWGRVVSKYDELWSGDDSTWQGIKPNEETFQLVFNAYNEATRRLVVRRIQLAAAGSSFTSSEELAPFVSAQASPDFDIEEGKHRSPRDVFRDLLNHLTTPASPPFTERRSSSPIDPETLHGSANTERKSSAITSALSYFVLDADYAAALVALRVITRLEIDIPKGLVGRILDALVERCRRELILPPLPAFSTTQLHSLPLLPEERRHLNRHESSSGPRTNLGWVDLFLNLQDSSSAGLARRRIRSESVQDTSRRVVSVARRALALASLDVMGNEAADATGHHSSSVNHPSSSSSDLTNNDIEGQGEDPSAPSQSQPRTLSQSQLCNLEIIDVLLSRALATECFLDGASDPSNAGSRAVNDAACIMLNVASDTTKRKEGPSSNNCGVEPRAMPTTDENDEKI